MDLRYVLLLVGGLLVATSASANVMPASDDVTLPNGYELSGEVKSCLLTYRIQSTKILDARTILFDMRGKGAYVNQLTRDCQGLTFENRFAYTIRNNQLCNVDVIQVVTPVGGGAHCMLGDFVGVKPIDSSDVETMD